MRRKRIDLLLFILAVSYVSFASIDFGWYLQVKYGFDRYLFLILTIPFFCLFGAIFAKLNKKQ